MKNTLWQDALRIIPGGNGLLSKRPERYAPDIWPTYFTTASGVSITATDGVTYTDMAQMGIGSAILGYAPKELTQAVCDAARQSVNCTLNCTEEFELAEKLIELNPFAGGVKFARTGGEAMSIAIRIARAASKRDKVAFSGYHGWCDWYLAANIGDSSGLSQHLIPGLNTHGVPSSLKSSSIPFIYNSVDDFIRVVNENSDIGVICIEGARYDFPRKEFLEAITDYARKNSIVIVSDEITSGWRLTDGGVYKINGFNPDIVVYGKAMGGGYAISAVVGKQEVMDFANTTFISSTMWTERIGFVAGLKTIEILTRDKTWIHLNQIGDKIGKGWESAANKHGLLLSVTDFKPLITFKFGYSESINNLLLTLFTQEMLKRKYLAASSIYVSSTHNEVILEKYFIEVDEVFALIKKSLDSGDILQFLNTNPRSDSFGRLTK